MSGASRSRYRRAALQIPEGFSPRRSCSLSSSPSPLPGSIRLHYDGLLQREFDGRRKNTMKLRSISYWVVTGMVAFFIGSGGLAELVRVPGNIEGLVRLGYPEY